MNTWAVVYVCRDCEAEFELEHYQRFAATRSDPAENAVLGPMCCPECNSDDVEEKE